MFGGRFGSGRFSLGKADLEYEYRARFPFALAAAAGVGKNAPMEAMFHSGLSGSLVLTPGVPGGFQTEAELCGQAEIICHIPTVFSVRIALDGNLEVGKDIAPKLAFPCGLRAAAWLGKDIWTGAGFPGRLAADLQMGKNVLQAAAVSAILNAVAAVYTLENETMELDVSIPANGRLFIDCDNFNVLLNGQNVLHLHRGGWVSLDRDAIRMVIDSGTGGTLSGNLIIREKFL